MLNTNKELKRFYSIKEVAAMFDVSESLLRFWETEFPNIHPHKGGRGIRQYTKEDIEEVRTVHHLVKERGMTLQGARDTMKRDKAGTNKQIEIIERLTTVRDELQAIGKELGALD